MHEASHNCRIFPAKSFCQLQIELFLLRGELTVCDLGKQSQSGAAHVCSVLRQRGWFYDMEFSGAPEEGGWGNGGDEQQLQLFSSAFAQLFTVARSQAMQVMSHQREIKFVSGLAGIFEFPVSF